MSTNDNERRRITTIASNHRTDRNEREQTTMNNRERIAANNSGVDVRCRSLSFAIW
jgi:hypothetical protein